MQEEKNEKTVFLTPTEESIFIDYFNNRQEMIEQIFKSAKTEKDVNFYFKVFEDAVKMSNIDFFEKHAECFSKIPNQKIIEFFNFFNKNFSFKSEVNLMQIPFNTFYEGKISQHSKNPGELKQKIHKAKFLLNEKFQELFLNLKEGYKKDLSNDDKKSDKSDVYCPVQECEILSSKNKNRNKSL